MTKTDEEEKIGFVDKIDRAFSVLGILVAAEDELFERIQLVPGIKKYERLIVGTGWLCSIMGAFFLLMGIVAHFFYVNKNALGLLGLVSALHVSIGPASYFGIRKKNRRVLFIVTSLNASWICLATLLTIYCVTLMEGKDLEEFNEEIVFHVGLGFYLPLAIFEAFANLMLVKSLVIMKEDKTKTSGQAGPKEGMKEEKSWENSLSTNSSSKSSSISKSVSGTSKSKKTTSKKVTTKKQVKDNNLKSNSKSISHLKK